MSDELLSGLGGALIGAIVAGVFAWLIHRSEQLSFKREELRKIITGFNRKQRRLSNQGFGNCKSAIEGNYWNIIGKLTVLYIQLNFLLQFNLFVFQKFIQIVLLNCYQMNYLYLNTKLSLNLLFSKVKLTLNCFYHQIKCVINE